MRGERITRRIDPVERALLSITLTVQPDVLNKLTRNDDLNGNGAASRFLYSNPPPLLGSRRPGSMEIPSAVSAVYEDCLHQILNRAKADMTLSPQARETYNTWHNTIEAMLAPGGELDGLGNGWGGKIVGNTVRIAGLLAIADGEFKVVGDEHVERATLIGEYFVAQARHIFGADIPLSANAAEVLRFLHTLGKEEYRPSDLRQKLKNRKRFEEGAMVDNALKELMAAGLIR